MNNKPSMTFALNSENKLVHVDSVECGLKSNCICPCCGKELIAKNNNGERGKRVHHFAHLNGTECKHGYDTSIALLLERVLLEAKRIHIPHGKIAFCGKHLIKEKDATIISVKREYVEGNPVPNIILSVKGMKDFYVEVYTSKEPNIDKLKARGIATLGIDLMTFSREINLRLMRNRVTKGKPKVSWVYSPIEEPFIEKIKKNVRLIPDLFVGEQCPRLNKQYVYLDCVSCYLVCDGNLDRVYPDNTRKGTVSCIGHMGSVITEETVNSYVELSEDEERVRDTPKSLLDIAKDLDPKKFYLYEDVKTDRRVKVCNPLQQLKKKDRVDGFLLGIHGHEDKWCEIENVNEPIWVLIH